MFKKTEVNLKMCNKKQNQQPIEWLALFRAVLERLPDVADDDNSNRDNNSDDNDDDDDWPPIGVIENDSNWSQLESTLFFFNDTFFIRMHFRLHILCSQ